MRYVELFYDCLDTVAIVGPTSTHLESPFHTLVLIQSPYRSLVASSTTMLVSTSHLPLLDLLVFSSRRCAQALRRRRDSQLTPFP